MKQEFINEQIYYYKNENRKEVIMEKLRSYGYRITRQRQVLLDVILGQDCTSCKEMYYKVKSVEPTIGMSTLYRMVSVLEEVGVFSRKNLYKISCCMECDRENACVIEFEDNTFCQLSAKIWHQVISEGLKVCGLGDGKKIIGVEVEPCKNGCGC